MRIRPFTSQIGGELRIGRCDEGKGARFTVLFPAPTGASD
jgi:two-component system, sensor histidine kinase PdtaS